jgi:hypothetical protein
LNIIDTETGNTLAGFTFMRQEERERFEYIADCVNVHDELVTALRACYERLAHHDNQSVPELLLCEAVFAKIGGAK